MPDLKQALRNGRTLIGTWLNAPSPSQVEMIGHAGFDFVVLDTEHSSYDLDAAENLVRAADAAGMPAVIRVHDAAPVPIGKALDFGALGVMVPHVSTAEEARRVVSHAHYAPRGVRGGAPTVRATRYGTVPWPQHLARAASTTLVIVQIEGREGIEHLAQILAVDGVDVVFIGPFDLSASLGVSGELEHPLLLERVGAIVQQARDRGIAVGIWMPQPEQLGAWIARGVQLVTLANSDMIFGEGCRAFVERLRALRARHVGTGRR